MPLLNAHVSALQLFNFDDSAFDLLVPVCIHPGVIRCMYKESRFPEVKFVECSMCRLLPFCTRKSMLLHYDEVRARFVFSDHPSFHLHSVP